MSISKVQMCTTVGTRKDHHNCILWYYASLFEVLHVYFFILLILVYLQIF